MVSMETYISIRPKKSLDLSTKKVLEWTVIEMGDLKQVIFVDNVL